MSEEQYDAHVRAWQKQQDTTEEPAIWLVEAEAWRRLQMINLRLYAKPLSDSERLAVANEMFAILKAAMPVMIEDLEP